MLKSATILFGDAKNYLVTQRNWHLYFTMQRYVCVGKTQIILDLCYFTVSENITYSGNPKVRYDTVFSLGPFNINKSPFRCPYVVTPFGVAGRGKASREIACIGNSVLWEP